MAGKFLKRDAIIDSIKSEHRTNSIKRRRGLTKHPIEARSCGCPDPSCGAFHMIRTERVIPTADEAVETLSADKKKRRVSARAKKTTSSRNKRKPA